MKKSILITVLFLLVVSFAGAAGQNEAGGDSAAGGQVKTAVTNLTFYRYSNAAHNLYTLPLIETFEADNPMIKIESVEVSSGGFEALATKVLLALAAGTPPDVCEMGYTLINTMVESGSTVPLDPFMAEDSDFQKLKINQAMMNLGKANDKQYLMPLGVSTPAMFINRDLFIKVGLDPDSPPRTWEETEKAAQILKDAGYNGVIWSWTTTGNWIFQSMIENAGGSIANDDASEIYFAEKPGIETMDYLNRLASKKLMAVTDQVIPSFYKGDLGMIILSSFNRVSIPETATFDVSMAQMPTPTIDGTLKLPAGGKGYMMLAQKDDRQNVSWKFISFLAGEKAGRIVAANSGYTPMNLTLIEKLVNENADDSDFVLTLEQAANVTPWYSWPGVNGSKVSTILRDVQESILLGKIAPKEGLEKAAEEARKLMKY
jgi:multiple sugar transport system substrate-binding protein